MDRVGPSHVRRAHTPVRDQMCAPSATRINIQVRGTQSAQSVAREASPVATRTATLRASFVRLVIRARATGISNPAPKTTCGHSQVRALALRAQQTNTRRGRAVQQNGKAAIRVPRDKVAMVLAIRIHARQESTAMLENARRAVSRTCTAPPGRLGVRGASRGATPTVYLDFRAQKRRGRSAQYARRVPRAMKMARQRAWRGRPPWPGPDRAPNVGRIANLVRPGWRRAVRALQGRTHSEAPQTHTRRALGARPGTGATARANGDHAPPASSAAAWGRATHQRVRIAEVTSCMQTLSAKTVAKHVPDKSLPAGAILPAITATNVLRARPDTSVWALQANQTDARRARTRL